MALRAKIYINVNKALTLATSQRYYCQIGAWSLLREKQRSPLETHCGPHNVMNQSKRSMTQASNASWLSMESTPINCAYSFLTTVHDNLGLPWWGTIVLSTIVLRTCVTLPIFVATAKNSAKLELLAPEMKKLANDLKMEVVQAKTVLKWSERTANFEFRKNLKRHVKQTYIRENCHPGKNFVLPWFQIPIWLSMSFALRNMSGMTQVNGQALTPELATEGILWFQNMILPDHVGLPLIFCATNFIVMEIHNLKVKNPQKFQRVVMNILRLINIVMFPIAAMCPSSMSLFWTCSSVYGLAQNVIVSLPKCRRILGIPKTPSEVATPIRTNWELFKDKFTKSRLFNKI